MKVTMNEIDSFPPNENPFAHDLFNMGRSIGKDLMIMYRNHTFEECNYLILVNTLTGERVRLSIEH